MNQIPHFDFRFLCCRKCLQIWQFVKYFMVPQLAVEKVTAESPANTVIG